MDISDLALQTIARQHAEIERLTKDRDEYAQAASVEAGLRREFLVRAEKAEAEIDRLRAALKRIVGCREYDQLPSDADAMAQIARDAITYQQNGIEEK